MVQIDFPFMERDFSTRCASLEMTRKSASVEMTRKSASLKMTGKEAKKQPGDGLL